MIVPACKDLTQSEEIIVIPEIRVWCHPKGGGDDYYKVFNSFKEAVDFIVKNENNKKFRVEDVPLLAYRGYELNIYAMYSEDKK